MNTAQIIKAAVANILEKRQMQTADIYCLRIHADGFGFGARTDTGEQVYMPHSVVRGAGLVEDEIVTCALIVNTHPSGDKTPWVAIRVERGATTPPPAALTETLDERVLQLVREQGMITTSEVAQEFPDRLNSTCAHNLLMRLFTAGKVVKADVYARPDQSRASFCLWAADVKVFSGEED